MFEALVNWLLAYMLHSSVLLGAALLTERAGLWRRLSTAQAELGWRWALFGPLLTASWPLLAALAPPAAPEVEPQAAPMVVAAHELEAPPSVAPSAQAAPAAPAAPVEETPVDWLPAAASTATVLWLAGATAALLLLLAGAAWLARAVRRLPANGNVELTAQVRSLAQRAGLKRAPQLRIGTGWSSPLLTPGGTICLPRWVLALSAEQRDAVLAHELAHLQRRDPAWRVAAQALLALAWMQPLNRLALRRLDLLAELACDAWAARLTGSPLPLAESLLHAAEQPTARAAPRLAMAMSSSPLTERLQRLLKGNTMSEESNKPTARKTRWAIAAGMLIAAIAVPTVVVHNAGAAAPLLHLLDNIGSHSFSVMRDGSVTRIETGGPEGRIRVDIHGVPQFNEDETDIISLQGRLEIKDKRNGHERRLKLQSEDGKAMTRTYERDGQTITALTDEDRAWLAGVVELIVQATVSADEQVKRLLARGGVDAVLARIGKLTNDNSRSAMIQALMKSGTQSTATVDRLLATLPTLHSDYERRGAMQALAGQPLSEAQQMLWLQRAAEIGSDFECREALNAIAPQLLDKPDVLAAWLAAHKAIHSDFEARSAIEALMAQGKDSATVIGTALNASSEVGGDFEHRSALEAIARRMDPANVQQAQAYASSAARIGSDFERREALVKLVSTGRLQRDGYIAVLGATEGMGSNFEVKTVLEAVAAHMPADADLVSRYRKLARKLSDFERGQAEKALDHLEAS